ncbi:MAG: hypothetical protein Q9187_001196 [Circinaria calcarea]
MQWSLELKWRSKTYMDANQHQHISMAWNVGRTVSGIPPRVRDIADSSVVTTVSNNMRYACLEATMEMVRNLEMMSFGERYDAAVRGLMTISYGVPIKVMCVGLYPYEQNILPTIATALAYSPMKCIGCTPSIQILSQGMAMVASTMKTRRQTRNMDGLMSENSNEGVLTSRFAMMLRCSYLCSAVGVAFTNCVPVPVDNMAKRVRCASLFSEWLGRIIEIHYSFGFKMTVMAMGAFAADTVRNTFSSFKGSNTKVRYIGVTNPAAIAYMNIAKYPGVHPIPNQVTEMETHIDTIAGLNTLPDQFITYDWKIYPKAILGQFLKEDTIGILTRALVDHTAEDLRIPFTIMARNLFSNMGASSIPSGFSPGAAPGDTGGGSNQGVGMNSSVNKGPSGPIFAQQAHQQQQQQGAGQVPGGGGGGGHFNPAAPFTVGRNSMIAQMQDSSGKSKSQQVIIIENMIAKLNDILESFRTRSVKLEKMDEKMDMIIDRHSIDDDDLNEVIAVYKERFTSEIEALEEATAVVAAMPAVIEGDTGVIENEIQPAAPLMRRYDGSTIRDVVWEQVLNDRESGVTQSRNPPTNMGIFSSTNAVQDMASNANRGRPGVVNQNTSAIAMEAMNMLRERAKTSFLTAIQDYDSDAMIDAVSETLYEEDGDDVDMMSVMIGALTAYMQQTGNDGPTEESLRAMIEMMEPPTHENMVEVARLIRTTTMDPNAIVEFFDNDIVE